MRSRATVVAVSTMVAVLMLAGMANATPHHNRDANHGRHRGHGVTIKGEVGKAPRNGHRHREYRWDTKHRKSQYREVRNRRGYHGRHQSRGRYDTPRRRGDRPFHMANRRKRSSDALRYVGSRNVRRSRTDYIRAEPFIMTRPQRGTTLSGWLDVSEGVPESVATIGLIDLASLRDGQSGRQEGAFIYVHTQSGGSVRIGVTDGAIGGELVQVYVPADEIDEKIWIEFTVEGTDDKAELKECANDADDVATADGCMTLMVNDGDPIVDSYGSITADDFEEEFADGAVPGWEAYPEDDGSTGIKYRLHVAPAYTR